MTENKTNENQKVFSTVMIKKEFINIPLHLGIRMSLIILFLLSSYVMSHKHDFDSINSTIVTTSLPTVLIVIGHYCKTQGLKTRRHLQRHRRERYCWLKVSASKGTAWMCVKTVPSTALNLNPHNTGTAPSRCQVTQWKHPSYFFSCTQLAAQ